MIHIYTGNGKGKTTAATGLTVRALGAGLQVFFAQFIKDGSSSEICFLREHGGNAFTYFTRGEGKFIHGKPSPETCELAAETLQALQEALSSGKYNVIVADEFLGSLHAGVISREDAADFIALAEKYPETEVILTGRNAPQELIEKAGLVTEMKCIKHYFEQKRPPRKGIEM